MGSWWGNQRMQLWKDSIELSAENSVTHAEANTFTDALVKWAMSPKGQAQLTEMNALQRLIPKDFKWERTSAKDKEDAEANSQLNAMRSLFSQHKLLINLGRGFRRDMASSYYDEKYHTIRIDITPIANNLAIKKDPKTGEWRYEPLTLEEKIRHEVEHSLQNLRILFGKEKPLGRACREEMAVRAEQGDAVRLAINSSPTDKPAPYRIHYTEPEENFKLTLDEEGKNSSKTYSFSRKWLNIPHTFFIGHLLSKSEKSAENRVKMLAPSIAYQSGCSGITMEELIAQTRATLNKYDVSVDRHDDATITNWINNGLKEQKLYPLEVEAGKRGASERK